MTEQELIALESAIEARDCAYAPYSDFRVGAAIITAEGLIFSGCNVENVSLGLTMCAERVAVGAALCAGRRNFRLLVIVANSGEPIVPCGACRQVLAEFTPALRIISSNLEGKIAEFELGSLLPKPRQGILDRSN